MSNRNLHNHFQDVYLVSLAGWAAAQEISPCDHGGPYMVTQEGYDPADMKMIAEEFVLGRSGQWLSLGQFFRMPVAEQRSEFIFGTAAEVVQMMGNSSSQVVLLRPDPEAEGTPATPETDEMAAASHAGNSRLGGLQA